MIRTYPDGNQLFYFILKPGQTCKCGQPAVYSVMPAGCRSVVQCRACFRDKIGWPAWAAGPTVPNDPWWDGLFQTEELKAAQVPT